MKINKAIWFKESQLSTSEALTTSVFIFQRDKGSFCWIIYSDSDSNSGSEMHDKDSSGNHGCLGII